MSQLPWPRTHPAARQRPVLWIGDALRWRIRFNHSHLFGGASCSTPAAGVACFTIPAGTLAGGTDTLTANYSGDANYAPSSGSNTVNVTKLTSTVNVPTPASLGTIESNASLVVSGTVTGSGATPTGTVTVSYGTTYTSSAATLNSSGAYSITITPNSLQGGTPSQTDTLVVNYSGDANYNAGGNTTSVIVKFFQVLTPTLTITPPTGIIYSGAVQQITVSLACNTPPNASGACTAAATATGTVTLYGGGYLTTGGACKYASE